MASPPGRPNPNKRAAASGKITVPDAASFVADLVLGDAGVAARLTVDAVRLLTSAVVPLRQELINCLRASPVMPARLCVAVLHSLLLEN